MRPSSLPFAAAALLQLAGTASAQVVTPRTIPVLQDEQFDFHSSSRPGLGGVAIALDDTLADPFANPAKATRVRGLSLVAMPYSHEIAVADGGGRTLPLTVMGSSGHWSGALFAAYQQIRREGPVWNRPQSERMSGNSYLGGVLARRLAGGVSVGASISHAHVGAVDGVDLMYAGSDRIDQTGTLADLRLGAVKEWAPGHALELLALRSRSDMTHDVHYATWRWDTLAKRSVTTERQERNHDETRIAGLHSEYTQPFGTRGWRFGLLATANRLSHPGIPNYTVQNIPRDPGNTDSYNLGAGLARETGPVTFAIDALFEPMSSDTWADRATDTTTLAGTLLRAGDHTVDNHFDFRNHRVRLGIGRRFQLGRNDASSVAVNLGLDVYAIDYTLRQHDFIRATTRTQQESWTEWTPGIGVRYRSRDLELSYAYRRNCGNQGCGTTEQRVFSPATDLRAGTVIAAPSGPLFFRSGVASSHRLTLAVPLL